MEAEAAGSDAIMNIDYLVDPRGGKRTPHLHYKGEIYLLNEKQWKDFSSKVLQDFSKKLAATIPLALRHSWNSLKLSELLVKCHGAKGVFTMPPDFQHMWVIQMKYTLSITQRCNLACSYCYINKKKSTMPFALAIEIGHFIYAHTPSHEKADIGFFGGEPLLEFGLLKQITDKIQSHPAFKPDKVVLSVVSNGTIFSPQIAQFLQEKKISFCISCDGPAALQDAYRRFRNGKGTSVRVEHHIKQALEFFPLLPINAVYSPENVQYLPETVKYLASLGVKNIYLNPNIGARWTKREADLLPQVYADIGRQYMDFYRQEQPRHISLIDSKIAVILRRGYQHCEKCRMGQGERLLHPPVMCTPVNG